MRQLPSWISRPTIHVERGLYEALPESANSHGVVVEVDVDKQLVERLKLEGWRGGVIASLETCRRAPELAKTIRDQSPLVLVGEDDGFESRVTAAELGADAFVGRDEPAMLGFEMLMRGLLVRNAPPVRVLLSGGRIQDVEDLAGHLRAVQAFHIDICSLTDVIQRAALSNAEVVVLTDGDSVNAVAWALESTPHLRCMVMCCRNHGTHYISWRCNRDGRIGEVMSGDMVRLIEGIGTAGRRALRAGPASSPLPGVRQGDIAEWTSVLDGSAGGCVLLACSADGGSSLPDECKRAIERGVDGRPPIVVGEGIELGVYVSIHVGATEEAVRALLSSPVADDGRALSEATVVGLGPFEQGRILGAMQRARHELLKGVLGE